MGESGSTGRGSARTKMSSPKRVAAVMMIVAGVSALLYVAWLTWGFNVQTKTAQDDAVHGLARELVKESPPAKKPDLVVAASAPDFGAPKVATAPAYGESIGIIYVPRFGASYSRPVMEGTESDVIDTLALGHYEGTAMPGGLGNFALAGHRQTHGVVLDDIDTLEPGDKIFVQTKDGFYTYVFRNDEVVLPSGTDVLLPVPRVPVGKPTERVLTLTSCNPKLGSEERIVAYSTMVSWQPSSAGPPAEIAPLVAELQDKK